MAKIIFITGTDTGVGKTVLTALLLCHLRETGCNALAMKPFCSGARDDAILLRSLQENLLTLDEINPFYFNQPLAPAAAAGRRKTIPLDTVVKKIRAIAERCEVLLVEGIGGVLVPLQKKYTVADLISSLDCHVFVVGRNRIGTINHTLLTANALQASAIESFTVVLMNDREPDLSSRKNPKIIEKMMKSGPVFTIPHLFFKGSHRGEMKINATFLKKTLAGILGAGIFNIVRPKRGKKRLFNKTR